MYNSFQNNGNSYGFQQPYNTGNQQSQIPQNQFQLRNANTTTEFGDFVSNENQQQGLQPNNTGFQQQGLQPNNTGFQQQGLQPNNTGFQQQGLQPNNTGFQQQGLQTNNTGFQQQGLQPNNTGFNQTLHPQGTGYSQQPTTSFNTFQQSFNQGLNPQATGSFNMPQTTFSNNQPQPLLPQQTGFYSNGNNQLQQGFLKPNATGFVNAMSQTPNYNNQLVLPNMRLSFVTAEDQKKFEKLFRSKVPANSNTISGANCREILMKSGLPPKQLAQIWNLADTLKAGELMFPEFVLAMYLINSVLQGENLPFALEKRIRDEVTKFVDAINFQVGEQSENSFQAQTSSNPTPFDNLTSGMNLQPQPTGMMPSISFGGNQPGQLQAQNTGMLPPTSFGQQPTGYQQPLQNHYTGTQTPLQNQYTGTQAPMTSFGNFNGPNTAMLRANQTGMGLVSQPTGVLPQGNFQISGPLTAQKTGFGNNDLYSQNNFMSKFTAENEDYVTSEEKALFYKIFDTYDIENKGILDSKTSVEIFRKSGLSRQDLEHIWSLADADNTGKLNKQEFTVGMHLVYRKLNGHALPKILPRSLIPQSTQMLDMMKEELKKQSPDSKNDLDNSRTKTSSFVNNDTLPSFRDRKNSKVDLEVELEKQSKSEENEKEEETLRNLIRDKKILIEAENYKNEERIKEKKLNDLENLKQIEILKKSIISLPKTTISGDNSMRSSYEALNARLVSILTSIDTVEDAIISAKIEKYKKQNPSSIVGTGPNGEVTEQDIRKAKKKAALQERMALLTGKQISPSLSIEEEEARFNNAVNSIKEESKQAKETVELIKSDITEILSGIKSALYGGGNDSSETRKFDLGVGLEPELKDFIKKVNASSSSVNSSPSGFSSHLESQSSPSPLLSGTSSQENLNSTRPTNVRTSSFQTPEERSAYIKEQAQKRMNEKLEKMGLGRRNRRTRSKVTIQNESRENQPEQDIGSIPEVPSSTSSSVVKQETQRQVMSEDDEDEEEKALRLKLESIRLKKQQKEERMRLLKQQIADAEKEEQMHDAPEPITKMPVSDANKPAETNEEESDDWNAEPTSSVPVQSVQQTPAKFNPFRNSDGGNKAPFFKQSHVGSGSQVSLNEKTAEEQRKSQRGLDSDSDGWSDEEVANVPVQDSKPEFYTPPVAAPPIKETPKEPQLNHTVSENVSVPPVINTNAPVKVMSRYNDDSDGWSDEEELSAPVVPKQASFIPEVPKAPPLSVPGSTVSNTHVSDDDLSLPESVSSDDEWD
ncbi:uncharacterized protein HGUI_00568 [Hanseniaspora guilliermondii]|uniref:Actin cytoskeleton-regulatory complex protein PAN1 n=1 Tax=Hanseniaspora guilliermondii TaxID=56406 RepID=A0A1L0AW83_9ASCO|nr:uncharacterized protein HGUI_00568 [Hanseniaspora guilliermondii]